MADADATSRFVALDVSPDLVAALGKQEIFEPTAIQVAALPVLRAGKDAYLHAETGSPTFRPPQLLKKLVRAGKLGRKSGEGFYKY